MHTCVSVCFSIDPCYSCRVLIYLPKPFTSFFFIVNLMPANDDVLHTKYVSGVCICCLLCYYFSIWRPFITHNESSLSLVSLLSVLSFIHNYRLNFIIKLIHICYDKCKVTWWWWWRSVSLSVTDVCHIIICFCLHFTKS